MPKPEQPLLPIALGLRDLGRRASNRLMQIYWEVVGDGKQDAVAEAIGISPAMLSMAKRSQRTPDMRWLPPTLPFDHERKILRHLAWESHCRVEPIDPFDDADFRKAAKEELAEAGGIGEQLLQRILERAQQVAAEKAQSR